MSDTSASSTDGSQEQPETDLDRQTQPVDVEMPPRLSFPVVGIGASAGGLEAVTEFLTSVRADSGMAYVFLQHLPPTGETMLVEILSKRTVLPVLHVEDQLALEPNHLYIIRPGHTLTIKDGRFHLGERLARPMHNRPVDDFFKSLAEEQRERAIAIVLSGMGSNGSAGAQAIKVVGGLCIAQDPETTEYPSMPRHLIDAGYADYILSPKDMPGVLLEYAGHPYASGQREQKIDLAKRDQQHLREILAILRTRTRQDFNGYKKPTVLRRVQRRMGLNRLTRLSEYARVLRQTPAEVSALADDLLIHVTGFFRDVDAWEALRQKVIVPMVASRSNDDSIRCWVTACSSGEEAYTLAMLLVEEAERNNKVLDIKVFATDMAERTLQNARGGVYPGGIESDVTPDRLERFFQRDDSVYRVRPDLRECVVFAPQNLLQDPPFSRLDLISCRNLLIYLEPAVQNRVMALLHFGLREGGALFLGTSETVSDDNLFETVDKQSRIYRRVGPTRHGMTDFPLPHALAGQESERNVTSPRPVPRPTMTQMITRALMEHHTPAAVTIDRDQRIVFYHGNTEPFIAQPRGEPTRDLLEVARENVRGAIRTAIQRARASNRTETVLDGWIEVEPGRKVRIAVSASPLDPKNAPDHLVISFQEHGEQPAGNGNSRPDPANDSEELRRVRDELQSTIEELQTSNEELKASHEEVVSTNEELQSTNEELETSREEMQSLNEELNTVNNQLHAKMEEHQAASNDLASLLSSTDIAVLFLDTKLRIRRFTTAVYRLMDLLPSDAGRPIHDMAHKFADPTLPNDMQAVLDNLVPIEHEVRAENGRWYLRRVLPYRTADNRIDGIVVMFVDINERKHAEEALRESEAHLRAITNLAPDLLWASRPDGYTDWYNQRWMEYTGQTLEQSQGWGWTKAIHPDDRERTAAAYRLAMETRADVREEYRIRRHDGVYRWFLAQAKPLLDERGQVLRYFGASTDIHEQRTALDAVREREEQFRLVFEGARDFAIIMTDPDSIITAWNVGAEHVLGFSEAEAMGRSAFMIFTPEDRAAGAAEQEVRRATEADRAVDERWHIRKSGERFWGSGVLAAVRNSDKSIRGFVKIMRDDTARKQAEDNLQKAKESAEQANRMKDDFLATLSHELRTPLSAILLWSKILDAVPQQGQFAEGLRAIRNSAEAQKELIEDLLDMSRITMGTLRLKIREVELAPLMQEILDTVEPTATAKNITIKTEISSDVGTVRIDPDRIRQITWNLLSNAVKFTPEKGRVGLRLAYEDNKILIRVTDTGQGISADFLPHIFERFRQADSSHSRAIGGMGLGLAITKQLVELHGGQITVASAGPGKGATFEVRLPTTPPAKSRRKKEPGEMIAPSDIQNLSGKTVLLIEDDAATRQAIATVLRQVEMSVTETAAAVPAVESFRRMPPDLIISDIGLPDEDGYALIRRIRQEERTASKPATPALALTAFTRETDRRMALEMGFQQYLGKPIDPEQLLDIIRSLLIKK